MNEQVLEIYDDSSGELVTYRAIELISGAAGQYIGQEFAETHSPNIEAGHYRGVGWYYSRVSWWALLYGPEHTYYDEKWASVLDTAGYIDPNDQSFWHLYQDESGNLWRVCRLSGFPQEDQHD